MDRVTAPPPLGWFDPPRPSAGEQRFVLQVGPLSVELGGLDDRLARALRERFGPFVGGPGTDGDRLRVRVGVDRAEYYIDPPERPEPNPILLAISGDRVRYLGYRAAGWFDAVGPDGVLWLARGDYEPADRAIENYLRAAIAWRAACRAGALVHGAGIVLDGRGYLFFGPSGAGKSTLAAHAGAGRVLSDDLTLVMPGRGGLELVGGPFRGTYDAGEPVVGRFPLVRGFRLIQDREAAVRDAPRALLFAQLVANLPFVAELFPARPDRLDAVEEVFRPLPLAHLHFTKDDSFWRAIADHESGDPLP